MRRLPLLALLCGLAFGQSHNFRPTLVQSNSVLVPNSCGSSCSILLLDNVTAGNVIFVAFTGIGGPVSPSDSLGTSYTMSSVFTNGPDGNGGTAEIQVGCGIAPTSGSNTITVASQTSRYNSVVAEFSGIGTCATDGTGTANAPLSGPITGTITVNTTTANSGDFCVTFGGNWWATSNIWSNGNTAAGDGSRVADTLDYRIVGAAGTQSIPFNINTQTNGGATAWLAHTQCYTPTFSVITDAMPHGVQGSAYTAQLLYVGGSGSTRTFSLASGSLPAGLSISAAGAITGTPSGATGTTSFKVQLTDGTNTVLRSLSIGIGASLSTPAIAGHKVFSSGPITYSATAGNLLLVGFWGQETMGSYIWTPTFSGTNNFLKATPALSFRRIYFLTGVPGNNQGANGAPFSVYAACVPTTTSYSIQFQNTSNTNLNPIQGNLDAVEVSGVQGTIDDSFTPATSAGFASSPGTITASGSTVVPNTMAMLFGANGSGVNSPFSLIDASTVSTETLLSANALVAAAGSLNGTMTSTCSTNCGDLALSAEVIPLRPEVTGIACGATIPGSGSNAPNPHKAQVY